MAAEVPPPLDVDRIVDTFRRHEVDFVVIGGIAVLAHGHPRATFDLDFMPDVEGARCYEEIAEDAVPVRGGAFRVVGLDDLVRMKRTSGRPKDLDDIVALTHHER